MPLLMVHGLQSTPVAFAALVNALRADPVIRSGYQIWQFYYASGTPVFRVPPDRLKKDRNAILELEHVLFFRLWQGNDMDTYADNLAELLEKLDLNDAALVGHSTGGGEVARYIGRHGTKRVAKVVLIGAVPPLMLKTSENPAGLPIEAFDGFRQSVLANRPQFFKELAIPISGRKPLGVHQKVIANQLNQNSRSYY